MTNATTPRIAVLGAGHVGPAIARLALARRPPRRDRHLGRPGRPRSDHPAVDSRGRTPMGRRRHRQGRHRRTGDTAASLPSDGPECPVRKACDRRDELLAGHRRQASAALRRRGHRHQRGRRGTAARRHCRQDAQPRRLPRARELRPTLRLRGSARAGRCRRRSRRRNTRSAPSSTASATTPSR